MIGPSGEADQVEFGPRLALATYQFWPPFWPFRSRYLAPSVRRTEEKHCKINCRSSRYEFVIEFRRREVVISDEFHDMFPARRLHGGGEIIFGLAGLGAYFPLPGW